MHLRQELGGVPRPCLVPLLLSESALSEDSYPADAYMAAVPYNSVIDTRSSKKSFMYSNESRLEEAASRPRPSVSGSGFVSCLVPIVPPDDAGLE